MKLIKHKSAAIASAIILSYGVVGNLALANNAEDEARQSDTEYISEDAREPLSIQWDIVGTHTGGAIDSEKFIKPAKDCSQLVTKELDYLLQLELCKDSRKGWLKI
jgi:hypothetical protein